MMLQETSYAGDYTWKNIPVVNALEKLWKESHQEWSDITTRTAQSWKPGKQWQNIRTVEQNSQCLT